MRRFKTNFSILVLAFFLGMLAYKSYQSIFHSQENKQIIKKQSSEISTGQIPQEIDFYTISPCKETADASLVLSQKKEKLHSNGGEGGFKVEGVNAMALCGVLPDYPDSIRSNVSGLVKIEVDVDKSGKVISAKAIDGNELLLKSSVEAAKQTRFQPYIRKYPERSVYYSGIISYRFDSERGVQLYKPGRTF